jgi:hypothetical protein
LEFPRGYAVGLAKVRGCRLPDCPKDAELPVNVEGTVLEELLAYVHSWILTKDSNKKPPSGKENVKAWETLFLDVEMQMLYDIVQVRHSSLMCSFE